MLYRLFLVLSEKLAVRTYVFTGYASASFTAKKNEKGQSMIHVANHRNNKCDNINHDIDILCKTICQKTFYQGNSQYSGNNKVVTYNKCMKECKS